MSELNVFKFKSYYNWRPRNWHRHLIQFFKNCKYACQRAVKGYCDRDLWNLDDFYRNLFIESLTEFRDTTHTFPIEFTDEQWEEKLTEAIHWFEESKEVENDFDDELFNMSPDDEKYQETREKWLARQEEIKVARETALANGMEILKTYFFELWD